MRQNFLVVLLIVIMTISVVEGFVILIQYVENIQQSVAHQEEKEELEREIAKAQRVASQHEEKYREKEEQFVDLVHKMHQLETEIKKFEILEENLGEWNMVEGLTTAYAPFDNVSGTCNDGNPNSTATGTVPTRGTFAVDPRRIPFGSTMIVVYDDGTVERGKALDTGGAMRTSRHYLVDVFRDTYEETRQHGVRPALILWKEPAN